MVPPVLSPRRLGAALASAWLVASLPACVQGTSASSADPAAATPTGPDVAAGAGAVDDGATATPVEQPGEAQGAEAEGSCGAEALPDGDPLADVAETGACAWGEAE